MAPTTQLLALAGLAAGALALGTCGGGDEESGEVASETTTVSEVTECFEGIGQQVREVEVSFAKLLEDKVVRSGNAIAVVSSDSSPDYRATIEECIPP